MLCNLLLVGSQTPPVLPAALDIQSELRRRCQERLLGEWTHSEVNSYAYPWEKVPGACTPMISRSWAAQTPHDMRHTPSYCKCNFFVFCCLCVTFFHAASASHFFSIVRAGWIFCFFFASNFTPKITEPVCEQYLVNALLNFWDTKARSYANYPLVSHRKIICPCKCGECKV